MGMMMNERVDNGTAIKMGQRLHPPHRLNHSNPRNRTLLGLISGRADMGFLHQGYVLFRPLLLIHNLIDEHYATLVV